MTSIAKHLELLKEKVFQTDSKWPQFKLLLEDIEKLSKLSHRGDTVVCFERTILYGGNSLFAPLFPVDREITFHSIDCSPPSADERGAYNSEMVDDDRFIKIHHHSRATIQNTLLDSEFANLVMVPNLVHHVQDQEQLFKEVARITKPKGKVYIFEPLVRELHQEPDDFVRYTPYGIEKMLNDNGLVVAEKETTGGPFEVISYCWLQALEYLPSEQKEAYKKWFFEEHFKELLNLDNMFPKNLERKHTSFPTAYSVIATKV